MTDEKMADGASRVLDDQDKAVIDAIFDTLFAHCEERAKEPGSLHMSQRMIYLMMGICTTLLTDMPDKMADAVYNDIGLTMRMLRMLENQKDQKH